MRDRLIELLKTKAKFRSISISVAEHFSDVAIEAIADHLLANGVIVPPVWAGQTVYHYNRYLGGVFPYLVDNVRIGYMGKGGNYWSYEANCHDEESDELLDELDFDLDEIGKIVFLTREEAEKALAEREGK